MIIQGTKVQKFIGYFNRDVERNIVFFHFVHPFSKMLSSYFPQRVTKISSKTLFHLLFDMMRSYCLLAYGTKTFVVPDSFSGLIM